MSVFLFLDKDTNTEPKTTLGQPTKDLLKQDVKLPQQAETPGAAESITPTAEKPPTETTAEVTEDTESETQAQAETESPVETAAAKDVPVSPYGFGPYPEIPEDYPSKNLIDWSTDGPSLELIWRVLIKLWTEGERNFRGGSTYKRENTASLQ